MNSLICLAASAIALAACSLQPADRATAPAAPAIAAAPGAPPQLLPGQPSFDSPEAAVQALYAASAAKDLKAMGQISGLPADDLCCGDATRDAEHAAFFAKAYDEYHKIVRNETAHTARVFFGKDNYPLASPLVQSGDKWFFDSAGGKRELTARIMDENQTATVGVCRTYVQAQYEYYSEDRNGDDVLQYAQQLGSTRGKHDGLYWHTEGDEPESPLGKLIADAREGYLKGSARSLDVPKPYHGYLFRILTKQGPHAPGGQYDYVINGRMVAGFALVAYPAKYGKTGSASFLVGANGKVYQKDLGEDTEKVAGSISEYDPDATWSLSQD